MNLDLSSYCWHGNFINIETTLRSTVSSVLGALQAHKQSAAWLMLSTNLLLLSERITSTDEHSDIIWRRVEIDKIKMDHWFFSAFLFACRYLHLLFYLFFCFFFLCNFISSLRILDSAFWSYSPLHHSSQIYLPYLLMQLCVPLLFI